MSARLHTSCRTCAQPIPADAAICADGYFHHRDCLPADQVRGSWGEAELQRVALMLASPKRAESGRAIVDQADPAHLPLFVAANEPRFL